MVEECQASHFRYGTISNIPLGENTRQPGSDSSNDCNPAGDGLCEKVQFQLQAAFRRNYKWGRYFAEQWRQGYDPDCGDGCGSNIEPDTSVYTPNVGYGEVVPETDWHGGPEDANGAVNYYNNNPHYDEGFAGKDTNGNDLLNENFYIRFPAYNGEPELVDARAQYKANENHTDLIPASGFIVPCPGPFTCDELRYDEDTYEWVDNTDAQKCASRQGGTGDADSPYNYSAGADSCAAWSLLYGMYLGDGTSMTIELTAEEIDYSDSQTGNFLKGTTFFYHYYEVDTSDPFVAFFTGGQRIYECSSSDYMSDEGECANDPTEQGLYYQLNNNAEARFRLEIEIWIRSAYYNRSPIATQIPTIPVLSPSTEVLSKFQIAAYDPDDDDLFFYFGDEYEMGGTARSKEDVYPWSANLEALALATEDQEVYEGGYNSENGQASGSGYGFNQYGDFDCNSDSKTVLLYGRCMQDRQPRQPYGVRRIDGGASFTSVVPGLVEWNTWNYDGGESTKLRRGYYNMVVMVRDVIPYDENDPSVNAEELYAWHDTASSSDGSTATSEEMYTTSNGRWSQGIPFRVKVPVDFMIYLYEGPLFFCNKGCKDNKWADTYGTTVEWENGVMYENARADNYGGAHADSVYDPAFAGLPTFANANGVYGTTIDPYSTTQGGQTSWPYLEEKDLDDLDDEGLSALTFGNSEIAGFYSPLHMACTICGMGSYYNYSLCSPQTSECGVYVGDTLVPSEASCIENAKPSLMSDGFVSDPWNHVGAYDANTEYLDTPAVADWREQQRIAECSVADSDCIGDTYKGAVEVNYLFGEDVYFWITAYDFDDCTHLRVLTTGLPKGPPDEAGTDTYNHAEFSEPLFETDYATWSGTDCVTEGTTGDTEGKATCPRDNPHATTEGHPTGVKVRRLFMWEAMDNARTSTGGDWTLDERPRLSSVCFYATDDYRVTYDPFYCVRIIFVQPSPPGPPPDTPLHHTDSDSDSDSEADSDYHRDLEPDTDGHDSNSNAGDETAAWEEVTVLYSASWISSEDASITDDSLFLSDYLQVTADAANVDISAVRIIACEVCCDDDQMGSPPPSPSDAAPNRRHVLGLDLPHRKLQSSSIEGQCKVLQDSSTFGSALSRDQVRRRSLLAGDAVTTAQNIAELTFQEVSGLLGLHGFQQYQKNFLLERIDGELLLALEQEDLLELGVTSSLQRKKLLLWIRKLERLQANSQSSASNNASSIGEHRHASAAHSDTCDSTVAGDHQRRILATEESKIWDMLWINTSVAFGSSTSSAAEFNTILQTPSIIYNEQVWAYDVPNITDIENVTITKGDNIWPATVEVCGTIQSDTVWYRNTTYYLTCQVFVNHTADLVIEPDTVVHAFKEHYNGVLILVTDENVAEEGCLVPPQDATAEIEF
ncbi:hypothetical protein CYMTET_11514 [Cymbomonas tetramitiformis]|uniref:SAM domain-containing protein n=1 Tax=Cymbomonas tetramitiformis TaxID=36881 RepID=A0AAE0LDE3_9CHLO|nr:hypothetical protein CYMTET_11514 [Cymbomonas tetramitiformis]